jgi:two-component system cell cycle response regulator
VLPILADQQAVSALPPDFWFWCAATSVISAIVGFVGGYQYARTVAKRTFHQASKKVSKLFELAMEALDSAQDVCGMLETFSQLKLTADQTNRLGRKRTRLVETVAGIVDSQQEPQQAENTSPPENTRPENLNIEWARTPEDIGTGLPNRQAFESNITSLLELSDQYEIDHGLLFVKIDKLDHLKSRFGTPRAENLLKKMASIVCLSLRDEDLACRFNTETLGVLMPDVDGEAGKILCEKIRETVRNHHFQLDNDGPEVLVTASFGFTTCIPGDNSELVLNRAGDAISKSQRRGRNQRHVHDGNSLAHCVAR